MFKNVFNEGFFKNPEIALLCMISVMSFTFGVWHVLLNNFVIEKANFTGVEIGVLQSLREVPGFIAFTAIFILLILKEQFFALLALAVLSVGVAITGFFPNAIGLYVTTVLMSLGFHYFETINKSLTLQWVKKEHTAHFMGKALAVKAGVSLTAYALIYLVMDVANVDYAYVYALAGGVGLLVTTVLYWKLPEFSHHTPQHKTLIFRKRYWLFYTLTFLSGARRQIFVVFAGFMMVEKFNYSVGDISALFIVNYIFNLCFASKIGKYVGVIGERKALIIEYAGLIVVFIGYALVTHPYVAATLYVVDHMFFAFAIAVSTYFQKIADPADIASTASVSFTINHIAAVVIPAVLGLVWMYSSALVFLVGVGFAVCSLILSFNIPRHPEHGNEVVLGLKG